MSLKGLIKKFQVKHRKIEEVDIPLTKISEIQSNLVYCRLINPEDTDNLNIFTNIIIEFYYDISENSTENSSMKNKFIELCNILGFVHTEFILPNKYQWIGLSITNIDNLKYMAKYLSKTPNYCNNIFVKHLINITKIIPYINQYVYDNDPNIYGYDSNDENIYIETFNLGDVKNTHIIHKDNINIFDSILYDNYEWLIRKCLLPLAGIVYIDSEFKTYSISLQYFIYKLGFEFDNDSILINELLLDYSNNVILGKHIYKDLSYFIDLPLPINDTNDEESEDSFVNDSYYEDIDEVVDK